MPELHQDVEYFVVSDTQLEEWRAALSLGLRKANSTDLLEEDEEAEVERAIHALDSLLRSAGPGK